jgi:Arc/MetJ family transcription regulator
MARTNIDIDEDACALVMRQRGFTTKRDAVNYALRKAAIVPFTDAEREAFLAKGVDVYDIELDEVPTSERLDYLVHDRYYTVDEAREYLRRWGIEFTDSA